MKPTKLRIHLSGHCMKKVTSLHDFDVAIKAIQYASWDVNCRLAPNAQEENYILPVPALNGHLVLCKNQKIGITFVPHNNKSHSVYKTRHNQIFEFKVKLSDHFEDGDKIVIHKSGGIANFKTEDGSIFNGMMTFDTGHGKSWTKAMGKVYPSNQEGDTMILMVNGTPDRHNMRIRLNSTNKKSIGKMKTIEDVLYKKKFEL